jgi:hypothetical protein
VMGTRVVLWVFSGSVGVGRFAVVGLAIGAGGDRFGGCLA